MILTGDQIKKLVRAELNMGRLPLQFFASDSTYRTVKKSYWSGTFYRKFSKELSKLKIAAWLNKHDCDNKAGLFMQLAQIPHAKSGDNKAEGVPVGEFWYATDEGGGHAINIIIIERKGQPKVVFFEPQSGFYTSLSDAEKKSAMLVKF